MIPQRIQLRRTKGWRKPPDTIVVARPTKWGNPFHGAAAAELFDDWMVVGEGGRAYKVAAACFARREWLWTIWGEVSEMAVFLQRREKLLAALGELRDHNLACWCPLDRPCHRDTLLRLSNKENP